MSKREQPKPFNMKDLFIDVKLQACVGGTTYDFLGRKLFNIGFLKQNMGFGITNIEVEVNTSLQPIITITFKDLYGSTIFGGQTKVYDDGQSLDYSTIFNWPPPKFIFSFKGYLGRQVSWVLNLKRTNTSFNSSDGSYEMVCEFVPNQWGFFADLPMLFLLAAKSLRKNRLISGNTKDVTSIFDLIKIGKQVEVKTSETTKEFDELVKQLGSLKSNISGSIVSSKVIKSGDKINGVVNTFPVKGFKEISIPDISSLNFLVNTEEKINLKISDPVQLNAINTYLLLNLKFGGQPAHNIPLDNFLYVKILKNPNDEKLNVAKNSVLEAINSNLVLIEEEIKRRVFKSSKTKLSQITIGEVFSQLGKDAAFIMGNILKAGLDGYNNNLKSREEQIDNIIGQHFPLIINDQGEEVPARGLGVDDYEMAFVRKFINAISEGIARDLIQEDNASFISNNDNLKSRINNAEMTKGNPYKPFYKDIATNILVRSGIVGYITRGSDPNLPGDYDTYFGSDRDGKDDIVKLADSEINNINEDILNSLSDIDFILLKRFCNFFLRFYEENGKYLRIKNGSEFTKGRTIDREDSDGVNFYENYEVVLQSQATGVFEFIENMIESQILEKEQKINESDVTTTFKKIFNELKFSDLEETQGDVYSQSFDPEQLNLPFYSNGVPPTQKHPLSFIDANYTARKIINNGICYAAPISVASKYYYIVFEGENNLKAQQANSSPTDIEYRNENKEVKEPLGYVSISSINDSGEKKLKSVEVLEERKDGGLVLDYEKLIRPQSTFFDLDGTSGFQNFLWEKEIFGNKQEAQQAGKKPGEYVVAGEFGYTIYSQFDLNNFGSDDKFVFDMFSGDRRSINQRIFIRRICQLLLEKINTLEEKRNQIIGSVVGKAAEQENLIYKQFHTIFHQWQVLCYEPGEGGCGKNVVNGEDLIERLEEAYGGHHKDIVSESDLNGLPDGAFVYEYPLQRINGSKNGEKPIKVRNSLISLEPFYKLNSETSVLNMIQNVCLKNNFLFIPIPGTANYLDVSDLYSPKHIESPKIMNYFHVLFTPTPETRVKNKNNGKPISLAENHKTYDTNSFSIKYGSPDNQIVSNIQVGTYDNKLTAESIVNLQRLVDNENQNKVVTTNCSTLPIMQGRSYTATIDMLGNAQVYPMQFFFLENSPLFGGLYQIMKVKHSITPNDMKTTATGIRMRFNDSYGSIPPITLETFESLGDVESSVPFSKDEVSEIKRYFDGLILEQTATSIPKWNKRIKRRVDGDNWEAHAANYISLKEGLVGKFTDKDGVIKSQAKWDVNAYRAGYGSDTIIINGIEKLVGKQFGNQNAGFNQPGVYTELDSLITLRDYSIPKVYGKQIKTDLGLENWNKLTKYQKVSLVSLGYNVGRYYIKTRGYGRKIKDFISKNDFNSAALVIYNEAPKTAGGKILPGLVIRRLEEAQLFLLPENETIY